MNTLGSRQVNEFMSDWRADGGRSSSWSIRRSWRDYTRSVASQTVISVFFAAETKMNMEHVKSEKDNETKKR